MMNLQERDQINQFLKQLTEVKLADKNPEAEAMIREAAARQPDAIYLLVQRSLLLEQALNVAKAKIDALEGQLQQQSSGASSSGFLGNDPWAQTAARSNAVPGANSYQVPRSAPQAAQATGAGNGLGFLGDMATTAAGVVAGSFLFQGIENLLGHRQSGWGWGQHPVGDPVTEHTVINNYYDTPSDHAADSSDHNDYLASADDGDFFDDGNSSDTDWI